MSTVLFRVALLLPVLLAPGACGFLGEVDFDGVAVREEDGVVYVDNVALRHARWVPVDVPSEAGALELASATRDIGVATVAPGAPARLDAQLFSELEGDGTVSLAGGRLAATSAAGGKVLVNGLRGTVPAGTQLVLRDGTGAISAQCEHGLSGLRVEAGTGPVELSGGPAGDIAVKSGTGDVRLSDLSGGQALVSCGTGRLSVAGLKCMRLEVVTGTGQVRLGALAADALDVETGTADVRLEDCTLGTTRVRSGTGDVRLAGTNDLGAASYDLGTGDVRQESGP